MSCCGRSNNRITRSQKTQNSKITKSSKQSNVRIVKSNTSEEIKTKPVLQPRQKPIIANRCKECNHPTVLVNIAGREREQCSNPSCRKIKR